MEAQQQLFSKPGAMMAQKPSQLTSQADPINFHNIRQANMPKGLSFAPNAVRNWNLVPQIPNHMVKFAGTSVRSAAFAKQNTVPVLRGQTINWEVLHNKQFSKRRVGSPKMSLGENMLKYLFTKKMINDHAIEHRVDYPEIQEAFDELGREK